MSATSTEALLTQTITDYGLSVLAVFTVVLVVGVGFLVLDRGWKRFRESLIMYKGD